MVLAFLRRPYHETESMPFDRIELNSGMSEAVRKTVEALQSGKVVVLPTETVYGLAASARREEAVRRLVEIKGRREGHPLPMAFHGASQVSEYATEMSPLAERLARRCWPGPVSLVLDMSNRISEFHHLPEAVRQLVAKDGTVCCRVPGNIFTAAVLKELNEPVVLTSANRTGRPEAADAGEIASELGAEIDLLVDDGPVHEGKPSTVLAVPGDRYELLREGMVKRETIERLTATMILFVCTGNTCRSPMAERMCEALLARRLDCAVDEVEQRGYVVLSAGLAAGFDGPASPQAVETMRQRGLDLTDHRSQQLNETHVRFADRLFAMTRGHREAILSHWPNADTRLSVLRTDGGDIADPIGGDQAVYEACARQMEVEIAKRLDEIFARS